MSEQLLTTILEKLDTMDTQIKSIKTGQSAIEQQLVAFQQFTIEQFTRIDDKFTVIDNKVTQLDHKFTALDNKVTQLDHKFTALDNKVTQLDHKVTQLEHRFTTLDNKVTATNLTIENEIRPSLMVITEQLATHSKILESHTKQLDRIEDKVTHHDIQISILDKTKSNKRLVKSKG